MSEKTRVACRSVDLTEEEETESETETLTDNNPFHFVECSLNTNNRLESPPPLTPINRMLQVQDSTKVPKLQTAPVLRKIEKRLVPNLIKSRRKTVGSFSSVQIKPPATNVQESISATANDSSNSIETVCLDSDEETEKGPVIQPPKSLLKPSKGIAKSFVNPVVSPLKQPGKIVLIKKNNKMYKIVIPHNVIPNLRESVGPVLINIPEVGPLVISNDPHMPISQPNPNNVVPPFSLNFDAILDANRSDALRTPPKLTPKLAVLQPPSTSHASVPVTGIRKNVSEKDSNLADKKYCWTVYKHRKRDLEGFTCTDRLGFNHAEKQRSRKCSRILDSIVKKARSDLLQQIKKFQNFKDSTKGTVKLVKINEIVDKAYGDEQVTTNRFEPEAHMQAFTPEKNEKHGGFGSYKPTHSRDQVVSDYDCDLLMTKKVVILNEAKIGHRRHKPKKETKAERRFRMAQIRNQGLKKYGKKTDVKLRTPCFVQLARQKKVEAVWLNMCKGMGNKMSRRKSIAATSTPSKILKRSPNQGSEVAGKKTSANTKEDTFYEQIARIFEQRMITSEANFKREIFAIKPTLLINEHNLGIVNYSAEFSSKNLIFPVKEGYNFPKGVLRNEQFISGVELGYIKLVDSELLCNYIMGNIKFIDLSEKEHSYCVPIA